MSQTENPSSNPKLQDKLAQNRLSCSLFDTDRFRRHIEDAYLTAWQIWQRGEPPRSFSIGSTRA